jgi:hypothetical protein
MGMNRPPDILIIIKLLKLHRAYMQRRDEVGVNVVLASYFLLAGNCSGSGKPQMIQPKVPVLTPKSMLARLSIRYYCIYEDLGAGEGVFSWLQSG